MSGCFNCGRGDDLQRYRPDLDLPVIVGCLDCLTAFALGDTTLLRLLRGPVRRRAGDARRSKP